MKNSKLLLCFLLSCFLSLLMCKTEEMQVATGEVSDIFPTTVKITGYIISAGDGIRKYGHCYAKTPDPTILDTKTEYGVTLGIGIYTSFLQGLEPGTKYYARAYISRNNITVYGKEINFTTAL